jgi:hypothetical protein
VYAPPEVNLSLGQEGGTASDRGEGVTAWDRGEGGTAWDRVEGGQHCTVRPFRVYHSKVQEPDFIGGF